MSGGASAAAAVILAGGEGRRMGCEKALLEVEGSTFVERHIAALAPRFEELLVSVRHGGPSAELVEAVSRASRKVGREVVWAVDREAGAGPLEGLRASLARLLGDRAFVLAVDVPEVDLGLVERLLSRLERPGRRAVVPLSSHGAEPAYAVYRRAVLPDVVELLVAGRRALRSVVDLEGVEVVSLTVGEVDPFPSLNTREEYSSWLARRDR